VERERNRVEAWERKGGKELSCPSCATVSLDEKKQYPNIYNKITAQKVTKKELEL
jgi:hypothetical protein